MKEERTEFVASNTSISDCGGVGIVGVTGRE